MGHLFKKHYTRDEARALLPLVKQWLAELDGIRDQLRDDDADISKHLEAGADLGGAVVNRHVRSLAELKRILGQFQRREIQVKDLNRGLIDFPALMDGKEVFLCWESGEEDIEFWHDLTSGYAGREPL
jgi:hypothetical protein